jgi:hypothetical protein
MGDPPSLKLRRARKFPIGGIPHQSVQDLSPRPSLTWMMQFKVAADRTVGIKGDC